MSNVESHDITLEVTENWKSESVDRRLERIKFFLNEHVEYRDIAVTDASDQGFVTLRIENAMSAAVRGVFLLRLEERIKSEVDIGITIWLEPVGDKSKLRKLRGVEIKT